MSVGSWMSYLEKSSFSSSTHFDLNLILFALCCSVVSDSLRLHGSQASIAHQASLSMGFYRQEYWSGVAFSSPGDLPEPSIKLASFALAGRFFTISTTLMPKILLPILVSIFPV